MKASKLLLILLIGLMSFTGFGSTTADLSKNSTSQNIVEDHNDISLSVVNFEVNYDLFQSNLKDLDLSQDKYSEVSISNELKYFTISELSERKPDLTIRDVGWQTLQINSFTGIRNDTKLIYRNPRDGINYFKSTFSLF